MIAEVPIRPRDREPRPRAEGLRGHALERAGARFGDGHLAEHLHDHDSQDAARRHGWGTPPSPVSLMTTPDPTKVPPITPPIAIIVRCRCLRPLCRPSLCWVPSRSSPWLTLFHVVGVLVGSSASGSGRLEMAGAPGGWTGFDVSSLAGGCGFRPSCRMPCPPLASHVTSTIRGGPWAVLVGGLPVARCPLPVARCPLPVARCLRVALAGARHRVWVLPPSMGFCAEYGFLHRVWGSAPSMGFCAETAWLTAHLVRFPHTRRWVGVTCPRSR